MKAHPLAELFPLMDEGALAALTADVGANGLREPIVLLDGMILDGRNRYRACVAAGLFSDDPSLPAHLAAHHADFRLFNAKTDGDPLAYVLSLNLARRHLNDSQRAMIAARLATMKVGRPGKDANLHDLSRADAAERLHVAPRTVAHAALVQAKAEPEIQRAVDEGKLAVSAASQAASLPAEQQRLIAERAQDGDARAVRNIVKQEARAGREAELATRQRALPAKKFGVIVADPEWRFEVYDRASGLDRSADNHYPTSSLEAIKARDVGSLAAEDCVLFLWSPANRVADAIDAMRGWGFAYVTQIVWGKTVAGTGYWVRDKHEVLLIGKRGAPPAPAMGLQCESLIIAAKGEHSAKPEIFLEIIERYFPRLPKIELNRRGPARKGWDAWGNEAEAEAPPEPAPATPEGDADGEGGEPAWWADARRLRAAGDMRLIDIALALGRSTSSVNYALNEDGGARARSSVRLRRLRAGKKQRARKLPAEEARP